MSKGRKFFVDLSGINQTPVNSKCPKVENFVYLTGLNQTPVNSECPKVENLC
jgi:hypothetical protein